jgi:hypothetical protein
VLALELHERAGEQDVERPDLAGEAARPLEPELQLLLGDLVEVLVGPDERAVGEVLGHDEPDADALEKEHPGERPLLARAPPVDGDAAEHDLDLVGDGRSRQPERRPRPAPQLRRQLHREQVLDPDVELVEPRVADVVARGDGRGAARAPRRRRPRPPRAGARR